MLEAQFSEGALFKKMIDSFKDLITEANFEFSSGGMSLQSMDSTHVVLVNLLMRSDGFAKYRCDRTMPIGINVGTLSKVIKCAGNEDSITIRADDGGETINFVFESGNGERVSDYDLKLMDLDVECVGCEDGESEATLVLPSDELQRICRDLMNISETVEIDCVKDSVRFTAKGDLGTGSIVLKSSSTAASTAASKQETKTKKEAAKKSPVADDEDEEMADAAEAAEEEEAPSNKAEKKERERVGTKVMMRKPVSLSVSLKFLSAFTKATALSPSVKIDLTDKKPMVVEYTLGEVGYVRFYLAPKIGDDE